MQANLIFSNGDNIYCDVELNMSIGVNSVSYGYTRHNFPSGINTITLKATYNSNYTNNFNPRNIVSQKLDAIVENRIGELMFDLHGLIITNCQYDMNGMVTIEGMLDQYIAHDLSDEREQKRKLRSKKLKRIMQE